MEYPEQVIRDLNTYKNYDQIVWATKNMGIYLLLSFLFYRYSFAFPLFQKGVELNLHS